jgi:hypothetical protein
MRVVVKTPGFESLTHLLITRDADDDAAAAFASIQSATSAAGLPVPREVSATVTTNDLHVTALVLPGEGRPGMLESLCWESLQARPETGCINTLIECAQIPWHDGRQDKRRAHAYLSLQQYPGSRIGEAAEKRLWDLNSPGFARLLANVTAALGW